MFGAFISMLVGLVLDICTVEPMIGLDEWKIGLYEECTTFGRST